MNEPSTTRDGNAGVPLALEFMLRAIMVRGMPYEL